MFEPNFHDNAYVEPLNLSTDELRPVTVPDEPMNDTDGDDDALGVDASGSIDIANLQLSDWIYLTRYKKASYTNNFFDKKKHKVLRENLPYRFNSPRRYLRHKLPPDIPLYLNHWATRTDTVVKWCFPYMYTKNNAFFHTIKITGESLVQSLGTLEDFEKLRSLVEHNRHKDPESLNDSDFDMLIGDENNNDDDDNDDTTETQIPAEQYQRSGLEFTHNSCQSDFPHDNRVQGLILIGANTISIAGEGSKTFLKDGINDCCAFNTSNGILDDILLVVQPTGCLLSILPKRAGLDVADSARVIQYWNLGAHGDWKIVKHKSAKALEFVLVNYDTQTLKFFRFISHYAFQLTNNLTLTDFKILSCSFFPNYSDGRDTEDGERQTREESEVENVDNLLPKDRLSHYLLFVQTTRFRRLVYLCIEWDSGTDSRKIVHQLTHLDGEEINGIIPLNANRVLGFSNNTVTMISANQIMSGEVPFKSVKLPRYLRGIKSWYHDASLLSLFQRLNSAEYSRFTCCNVVGTSTGMIYACMTNDTDIEFYDLTRFKGLRKISPAPKSGSASQNPEIYNMVIQSFNRTLNITLKLDGVKRKNVPEAYQNILRRKTLDITSDDNTQVAVIRGDTWKFSSSSITRVTIASADFLRTIPFIKLQYCFEILKPVNACNFIRIAKIPNSNEWKEFLGIDEPEECQLLLSGDDINGILKVFLYTKSGEDESDSLFQEDLEPEELRAIKLVELNDILKYGESGGLKAKLLDLIPIANLVVYIYTTHVIVESIASSTYETYNLDIQVENSSYADGILILWSVSNQRIFYMDLQGYLRDKEYQMGEKITFPHLVETHVFDRVLRENVDGKININYVKFLEKVLLTTSKGIYSMDLAQFFSNGTNPITTEERTEGQFFELPLNEIVIMKDKFICLTDGGLLHCFKDTDKYEYFRPLRKLPFKNQDVRIKKLDDNTLLAFTSEDMYMVKFLYDENRELQYQIYNLKLPYSDRMSPILDVVGTGIGDGRICVLFGSGLKVYQKAYTSYNYNSYLLRYSRSKNKIFRYLSKINRLLVLNCDYTTWNCIKLENGRYLSLPEKVLKGSSKVKNVVELPFPNERCTTLIVSFEGCIKCVRIVPVGSNIKVEEVCEYNIEAETHEKIYVNDDNTFFMLKFGKKDTASEDNPDSTRKDLLDCFVKFKLDKETQGLVAVSEYPFNGKGQVRNFEILDNKHIIITTSKGDALYLFKDIDKEFNPDRVIKLHTPSDSFVNKIVTLNNVCFAAAFRIEGREHCLSSLCFYSIFNAKYSPKGETEDEDSDQPVSNAVTAAATSDQNTDLLSVFDIHRNDISGAEHHGDAVATLAIHMDREEEEADMGDPTRPLLDRPPERHYIDGYIEYDHYIGNLEVFNPTVSRVRWQIDKDSEVPSLNGVPVSIQCDNTEYRKIELDKTVKDMSFDKESAKLVILTTDESVVEFKLGNARISHCDLKSLSQLRRNGGYYLAPAQQRVLEISKLVATPISEDGLLDLVTDISADT